MAAYAIIITATLLLAQAFCVSEVKQNSIETTTKTYQSLSYDELLYILQTRHGVPQKPKTLSPCARAILGCCKDKQMNESCSESLKCGAFFFDVNPCDDRFVIDALKAAKDFYTQLKYAEKDY